MTHNDIKALIAWYEINKREMPWRDRKDAYAIWISEMMLQQTQVKTVIPYFNRFISLFPDVDALADAKEETVLKAWEGLGYYSRARNIHQAAKQVKTQYQSVFPNNYEDILALKGIGPYTAGAIASIAFSQPIPAVDGNVLRVISRVLGSTLPIDQASTQKAIKDYLMPFYHHADPAKLTQALMELGATLCKGKLPNCENCPLKNGCLANLQDMTNRIPVKQGKTKQTTHIFQTALVRNVKGEVLISKRSDEGLLASLYEFYQVEAESQSTLIDSLEALSLSVLSLDSLGEIRHVFSHRIWYMQVHEVMVSGKVTPPYFFVSVADLHQYPMATAHKKILKFLK